MTSVDPWSLPPGYSSPTTEAKVNKSEPIFSQPKGIENKVSDDDNWGKVEGVASTPTESIEHPVNRIPALSLRKTHINTTKLPVSKSFDSLDSAVPTPITPAVLRDWEAPEFDGPWGEQDGDDMPSLPKTIPSKRTKAQKLKMLHESGLISPRWNSPYSSGGSSANTGNSGRGLPALSHPQPPATIIASQISKELFAEPESQIYPKETLTSVTNTEVDLPIETGKTTKVLSEKSIQAENLAYKNKITDMESKYTRLSLETSKLRSQLTSTTMTLDRVESVLDSTLLQVLKTLGIKSPSELNKHTSNGDVWGQQTSGNKIEEKIQQISSLTLNIAKELSEVKQVRVEESVDKYEVVGVAGKSKTPVLVDVKVATRDLAEDLLVVNKEESIKEI
ncbi:hypothetical protein HK096_011441, partial [Nowakowskiella sp. JEL0078]